MSTEGVGSESQEGGAGGTGGEGGPAPGAWREGISDPDLRAAPSIQSFATLDDFTKSSIETKSMVGRNGVPLPKEGDANDLTRFHREIGVPEDVNEYTYDDVELPEGVQLDANLMTQMSPIFQGSGTTPQGARKIAGEFMKLQHAAEAESGQRVAKVHETWAGQVRDKYGTAEEKNLNIADAAANQLFGENAAAIKGARLEDGSLLRMHPQFIEAMRILGHGMAEEHSLKGEGIKQFALTPDEAKRKIAEFNADSEKQKAYHTAGHPAHKDMVAEMDGLRAAQMAGSGG